MSYKTTTKAKNVISLNTIKNYHHYIITWFANAATITFVNMPVYQMEKEHLHAILQGFEGYIDELCSYQKRSRDDILEWTPIPLTPNDKRELLRLGSAINVLYDATKGKVETLPLPPALSLEFAEYVRTLLPQARSSELKRDVVGISTDVLALAIIGAAITHSYTIVGGREGGRDEHGYVFVDVYHPGVVDMPKLLGMSKGLVRRIMRGDGNSISIYIAIASAIVLNVGRHLKEVEGRSWYSSVRITRSGNKTMLKALEVVDLTSLARSIMELGIASSIYNLVMRYPSTDEVKRDRRLRSLRSFIESLARAIMIYHSTGNVEELYKVLRLLTSDKFDSDMSSCLGETWRGIKEGLLSLRV